MATILASGYRLTPSGVFFYLGKGSEKLEDLQNVVAQHTAEIANLKQSQRDSEDRVMNQIRQVQMDMRSELQKYDGQLTEIRSDVKGLRGDLQDALEKLRKSTPTWVGPVIGAILAIGGWMYYAR